MTKSEDLELINNNLINSIQLCLEKYFTKSLYEQPGKSFVKKIKNYTAEYKDYKHYYPLDLQWNIISECNLRCKHCFFYDYQYKFNSNNDLTTQQALDLIDVICDEFNIITITLTGGEPFLRKDIFEILQKLKSKNISLIITTNGTLVTKEVAKKLRMILNPKMDDIQVSLDGATKETHENIRGKGSYQAAIQGINNLVENEIFPFINCSATSYNVLEIPQLYKLAQDLRIKKLSIAKYFICSNNQDYLIPDINILFESLAKVIEIEKQGSNTYFEMRAFMFYEFVNHKIAQKLLPDYINKNNEQNIMVQNYICHRHEKINITADGKVFLCHVTANNAKLCLGNIKTESLIDIWSKRHQNVFFQKRISDKMICQKCKYFYGCRGGCPANAYEKYGDINTPDGYCNFGKTLMQNNL